MQVKKQLGRLVLIIGGTFSLPLPLSLAGSQGPPLKILAELGEGPALGSVSAPVKIVEFSDFQCSFCKKFWANTLPRLKETYIRRNQGRFTYRHFAILGQFSERAAEASECAAEQGKFWSYHDTLFASQGGLAFTDSKLRQYAGKLGLNLRSFGQCLDAGKYRQKVRRETRAAASLGVRGTPAFFVNNGLLVGAQPFEVFRAVIEKELGGDAVKRPHDG